MSTDVVVLILSVALVVAAAPWYVLGALRMLRHPQGVRRLRTAVPLLAAGLVVLVVATGTPLAEYSERRMWTHMTQHVVIIMVAAPLLAAAQPGRVMLIGMGSRTRRAMVRLVHACAPMLGAPVAWTVQVAALWIWHMPAAYDLAVRSEPAHWCEHLTFLLASWFWWDRLFHLARQRGGQGAAALYVAAIVPPGAALGAVLTFPDHLLYPAQAAAARHAGIDPLLDQRLAGLVMWVPLDMVFLGIAIALFGRWLHWLRGEGEAGAVPIALPSDARAESPR